MADFREVACNTLVMEILGEKDDRYLELDERAKIANDAKAALFLSIHNDSAVHDTTNGTCTSFYQGKDQPASGFTSKRFAELLQNEAVKQLQAKDLGIKQQNVKVLRDTKMPSALIEVAFISNQADRQNLMDEAFRDKTAQALYDGIVASLNELVSATPEKS